MKASSLTSYGVHVPPKKEKAQLPLPPPVAQKQPEPIDLSPVMNAIRDQSESTTSLIQAIKEKIMQDAMTEVDVVVTPVRMKKIKFNIIRDHLGNLESIIAEEIK